MQVRLPCIGAYSLSRRDVSSTLLTGGIVNTKRKHQPVKTKAELDRQRGVDTFKARDASEDMLPSQTARILLECNFRCPFCFAAWHEEKKRPSAKVMNTSGRDWKAYMDKMRERGFERIVISEESRRSTRRSSPSSSTLARWVTSRSSFKPTPRF